jgi:hypothetical protein
MHSINRDKLIVGLLADDIVEALNQAMQVRRISLMLDYSRKDHRLALWAEDAHQHTEVWMVTDTRSKLCAVNLFQHPTLKAFHTDIDDRLAALGGSLALVGFRPRQGPPLAKLQACVQGAQKIAVTLYSVPRGQCSPAIQSFTPMRHAA